MRTTLPADMAIDMIEQLAAGRWSLKDVENAVEEAADLQRTARAVADGQARDGR